MKVHKKINHIEAVQWHPGTVIKGVAEQQYGDKHNPVVQGWFKGRMNKLTCVTDGDWLLIDERGMLTAMTDQDFKAEYDLSDQEAPGKGTGDESGCGA